MAERNGSTSLSNSPATPREPDTSWRMWSNCTTVFPRGSTYSEVFTSPYLVIRTWWSPAGLLTYEREQSLDQSLHHLTNHKHRSKIWFIERLSLIKHYNNRHLNSARLRVPEASGQCCTGGRLRVQCHWWCCHRPRDLAHLQEENHRYHKTVTSILIWVFKADANTCHNLHELARWAAQEEGVGDFNYLFLGHFHC